MIKVKNLAVKTKNFALEDISLSVNTGSCHVIIGPTGCGKTTLLEAILGLRPVKSGEIFRDSENITKLPTYKRMFAYLPQDLAIFPHLTVSENIFFGINHGNVTNKSSLHKRADDIISSLNISHLLDRKPVNLSGGEKQRVALARALSSGFKYLLMDEPLSALHEGFKKELWVLLKKLQKEYNLTLLIVSHDMEETFFLADDVSVMIDGKIHQTGSKKNIYRYPRTLEIANFFGIKNIFKGKVKELTEKFGYIYVPDLNQAVTYYTEKFPQIKKGDDIYWGVRSEEVMILKDGKSINPKDTKIEGEIIDLFWKGDSYTVLFKPENTNVIIEIDISGYAFRKFKIEKGSKSSVALRNDWVFLIK
ncbi:ABC transporter ATP-binding protein [Deferribacterales bacterium Es71-Z0220]|uniref:ABC transporter ATP-binding protein n=1 Tax=Deferrivibrio essentukiensis TaxID=2880922 RepID=UPI001F6027E2|nr:ABC transporter ATP-binding protein [Deferrivibrio essentukiensis]